MNEFSTQQPITWVDIARTLATLDPNKDTVPPGILRAKLGWYGMIIETTPEQPIPNTIEWLQKIFPTRIKKDPLCILIEGPSSDSNLPIGIEITENGVLSRQTFGIVDGTIEFHKEEKALENNRPTPIVAALSIKGGTGRTTTAINFALQWAASTSKPVLLVDADMEAPGISYLFESEVGTPKIALEDLVTLAHSEESADAVQTIEFVAARLKDHQIKGNIFVLPLRRSIDELSISGIKPEHLSTPERPYALADMLSSIALKLGCCGVVIDVRAGLVPIGVNLALDPNVSPIIVTTLANQSIRATSSFVKFLAREIRKTGSQIKKPLLVINRVPLILKQTKLDKALIQPLTEQLISALLPEETDSLTIDQDSFISTDLEPMVQIEVPELAELHASLGDWESYLDNLSSSGFSLFTQKGIESWIKHELDKNDTVLTETLQKQQLPSQDALERLRYYTSQLISAENSESGVQKPLVTQPLAAVVQRFQSELPIAIMEGVKGTGKTLAARFFIASKDWKIASETLVPGSSNSSALFIPACGSIQSSQVFQAEIDKAREFLSSKLRLSKPFSTYNGTSAIKGWLESEAGENTWVERWLDLAAWCTGYKPGTENIGEEFLDYLRQNETPLIAIFEGLEEFQESADSNQISIAMRALLIGLPQRLRAEARRPLGILVFARSDTVASAVKQNLDQFRREYANFALNWKKDDVLELAAWLATNSGALPGLWSEKFKDLSSEQKASSLAKLWGTKMGVDDKPGKRTREAYTATWIVAVLSDLRGRLVPRDLVRLLSSAASIKLSTEDTLGYETRLLKPKSLRKAVEPTSKAKVKETEEEIIELQPIFEKFRKVSGRLSVPLEADQLRDASISDIEIITLIKHGVAFGDSSPYEVPELFRIGLGLKHQGARRSILNLYRKAKLGSL